MTARTFWIGVSVICSAVWASAGHYWVAACWQAWGLVLLAIEITSNKATGGKA